MATNRSRVRLVQRAILRWFQANQRDLPWRHSHDSYNILVSEVMLQQTQVDRVIPKYREFLRRFPSVRALARATPRDVLLAWAGMGYNRRALYLHRMARAVVRRFNSRVPTAVEDLQQLPGVGAYTAAAVATFSTGVPHPMADTNVNRVLSRVFLGRQRPPWPRPAVERLTVDTLPRAPIANTHPALWSHAVMDFGALVCKAKPRCEICPLTVWCKAYPRIETQRTYKTHRSDRSSAPVPDRIYRGKILAMVRHWDPRSAPLADVQRSLAGPSRSTVERLVRSLVRDGLLVRRGRVCVRLPTA